MIDNIKITLNNFSGNFINCDYAGEEKYDRLYTLSNKNKSYKLYVKQNKNTGKVVITRSLRKWFFNKGSLLDLNLSSLKKSMKMIASELNIPLSELCKGKITQCEIGQNVKVKIPATEIIPRIVDYARFSRKSIKDETLYFNGTSKKVIIYDKLKEIGDNGNESKRGAMKLLRDKGYHFLRIEFKLFNQKSFNQSDMHYISTVGDLIIHYHNLYEFWVSQVNRLVLFSTIEKDIQNMSKNEYLIGVGLNHEGFEKFVKDYQDLCKSKTKNGLKSARSKAYKEVINVLDKYSSNQEYGKKSLKVDITKHLLNKRKQEELDISLLIKKLWS